MDDFSQAWLRVLDCPEAKRDEVNTLLTDTLNLGVEWEAQVTTELDFGALYTAASANGSFCTEVMQALEAVDRGIMAWAGQAAVAEWSPWTSFLVPGLGLWEGEANDEGEPVVPISHITAAIEEAHGFDPDLEAQALAQLSAEIAADRPMSNPKRGAAIDGPFLVHRLGEIGGLKFYMAAQTRVQELAKLETRGFA